MCKSPLHPFLAALPKCEHHLHLEGCLTPQMVFTLAAKNSVSLPSPEADPAYASPEALAERYRNFSDLEDFLQYHYRAMRVLTTASDFEALAWEYFTSAHADGVRHAEVFFDPQSHTARGISFDIVVTGYSAACRRAERELGLTNRLIMCFLRHIPSPAGMELVAQAQASGALDGSEEDERTIAGFGLDSSEIGFPAELFTEEFAEAKKRGLRRTAHAGEEGDVSYIRGALDALDVERIDHGIRIVEDEALMERAAREGILFTLCPLSNVFLKAVPSVADVPIRTFLDCGIRFSLGSDDPAYFGGYVLNNYCAVQEAFALTVAEWRTIAENSIDGSWIKDKRKGELRGLLDECCTKYEGLLP
ncbi:adenosine deaminase [Xylariales sp. PMI_506]|nr:adenosine deaminase [Xylariales sp. PMI_506]